MGHLAKLVIERLKAAQTVEDLDGWGWKASDLLAKSHSKAYHSGFAEIDDEVVSSDERDELRSVLLEALNRSSDPKFVSQILDAIGSARDESLKQLFVDYLVRYLQQLKASNAVVYSALVALRDVGEPVFERRQEGNSSFSAKDVDENIRQADGVLERQRIFVPW